jgi:uncharacterized protein
MTPLELIHRYVSAMKSGDRETGYGYFADDIVFTVPGRSKFAGTHHGRDTARNYIETAIAHSDEGEIELELVDTLASEDRVALIINERFIRTDGVVEIPRANVYRVKDDKIVEIRIYEGNQYGADALIGG